MTVKSILRYNVIPRANSADRQDGLSRFKTYSGLGDLFPIRAML
jgi:hypothetical protein